MDWVDLILKIIGCILICSLIFLIIYGINLEEYKSDIITDCNDADGDLIEELTCYKTFNCNPKLKFNNADECEELMKPKIYNGPMKIGYNETHFRLTGETIRVR